MTEAHQFIDDLLKEAEEKEQNLTAAHYDIIIKEVAELEKQIEVNFETAKQEAEIIQSWALSKNSKLQDRVNFYRIKLEAYIRQEGKKTLDLPNGILKLHKKPDKVEVSDLEMFLKSAESEMLAFIPEQVRPDLNGIKAFIKRTGRTPEGVSVIGGKEEFSLKLKERNINATSQT